MPSPKSFALRVRHHPKALLQICSALSQRNVTPLALISLPDAQDPEQLRLWIRLQPHPRLALLPQQLRALYDVLECEEAEFPAIPVTVPA